MKFYLIRMSKLHKKTGTICLVCEEKCGPEDSILFHKTRRQTHKLCFPCSVGYLTPIFNMTTESLRKNIKKNIGTIRCPGSYRSKAFNMCKKTIDLNSLRVPGHHPLFIDFFRISYSLTCDTAYLCPVKECGELIDVDQDYIGLKLICRSCATSWCRQCFTSPHHDEKSCIEFESEMKNTENGKLISDMKEKGILKFCPRCRVPTIKHDGCNKMYCTKCGLKWCWLCLSDDIDYDHYNSDRKGGCSGRLWEGVDENGNAI